MKMLCLCVVFITGCTTLSVNRQDTEWKGLSFKTYSVCINEKYYMQIFPFRIGTHTDNSITKFSCTK